MDKAKINELFIRYGSAASEAMLDFPCHFFTLPDCEGLIAYRIENHCAVVIGEPICPPEEIFKLTEAFNQYCKNTNLKIIFITVSETFTKWALEHFFKVSLQVCEEYVINPQIDILKESHRMQHRVKDAIKHGVTFHEYIPFNEKIEKTLNEVGQKWNRAIKGPHLYLGHLNFFESYEGKRWFYAQEGDKITSMIMLSRLDSHQGWLLKFLTTVPKASHYTSEFLMCSVLETLRNENCNYLSKGMLPLQNLGEIRGLSSFSAVAVQKIYQLISWIFKFKKRKEYWLRYNPQIQPSYLVFSDSTIGINEIRALIKAFKATV